MPDTRVYLETGAKKVFACAVEWPGWARAGKTEQAAIEALDAYAGRYAAVAKEAGLDFAPGPVTVAGRVAGDATTDFGAPGKVAPGDDEPVDPGEAGRLVAVLAASWRVFDEVAAHAPAELRKGPRGGGRDRDKMVDHVIEAELSYARYLGVKAKAYPASDLALKQAFRDSVLAVVRTGESGGKWPVRYAVRRMAWHVLDHAWEMEDRASG